MTYATDPTTLRSEARDIEIGAPDGNGYAPWLRACANRIEDLEAIVADLKAKLPAEIKEDAPTEIEDPSPM